MDWPCFETRQTFAIIQMLHDLVNDGGFVALKWSAEDREEWRHRERMSETYDEAIAILKSL